MSSKCILVYSTQQLSTGGIESHLLEFCTKISQAGTCIDLIILNSRMTSEVEEKLRKVCRRVFLGSFNNPKLGIGWLLKVRFKLRFTKYQALYTNGQGNSIFFVANIFGVQRWVHHHHNSGDADDRATWGFLYKQAIKNASIVIACSKKNATDIEFAVERKINVIPCFSRKIETKPKRKEMSSGNLNFGYYGRLIPEKGIDTICRLSADPDCKGIIFHLWGEGEAYSASSFNEFPNVEFHGSFSGTEGLKKVITSLDALLLLSIHSEGLPISLLEGMSAGLPWLATDKGGIPDIACDPVSTRVISHLSNYQEMKNAVLLFASDIAAGKISSEKQKELYTQLFSPEVLVSQWKSILEYNSPKLNGKL